MKKLVTCSWTAAAPLIATLGRLGTPGQAAPGTVAPEGPQDSMTAPVWGCLLGPREAWHLFAPVITPVPQKGLVNSDLWVLAPGQVVRDKKG